MMFEIKICEELKETFYTITDRKMITIWEDWKKHREFTKTNTIGMTVDQVRELYDRLREYTKHLVELQHDMKQKMKQNNTELWNLKVQLSKERKELKKEIYQEMRHWKNYNEEKAERDKRLKEEFMKLL